MADTFPPPTVDSHTPEASRRDFLYIATATVGLVGAAAALVPLVAQMNPDASTLAAGGPVELDVSKIAEGQQIAIRWRQRPIFVFRRSKQILEAMQSAQMRSLLADPTPTRPSSRLMRPIGTARSNPNSASWSASAPILAASRCSIRRRAQRRR